MYYLRYLLVSALCGALWLTSSPTASRAEVREVFDGEDLFAALAGLAPGDEVIVHDGTWTTPGFVQLDWQGTAALPIVVRAAAGAAPHIVGDPSENTLNITGAYFVFRGFEVSAGSHGIRLSNVHDATLEDLHVHDTGDVAVSANIPGDSYRNNVFRGLHIHDTGGTGEGMYLGCNWHECEFHDNVIEACYIHHTNQGTDQGDGIEIKTGSSGNLVRNNVIHDTGYPGIIVYGAGGGPRNVIENNVIWNVEDNGIQAAADAIVRNNIVVNAANGIQSGAHQDATPGNLLIVHNTVMTAGDSCLRGNDWGGARGLVVANNALYCEGGRAVKINGGDTVTFVGNVVVGGVEGVSDGFVNGTGAGADFVDAANFELWPADGSPLIDGGDPTYGELYDFNWTERDLATPDVGAYEWQAGGNPGWIVGQGFRDTTGAPPPTVGGRASKGGCHIAGGDAGPGGWLLLLLALVLVRRLQGRA